MERQRPTVRDIRGAMNGSRFVEQPHIRLEVKATLDFIAAQERVLVEIGFDHGRRLHATARHHPNWQVLGLEVRKQRVLEANERARRDALVNLRAWRFDARTVFANVLPDRSVDVVDVLFPTPWWHPGLREKRLLVDDAFVADVARVLKPGGLLYVATDVHEYADRIESTLRDVSNLRRLEHDEGMAMRPHCSQLSRREWRCQKDGIAWRSFFVCRV